jgi:predicted methyltransferase
MPPIPVLSHIQAAQLLDARGVGQPTATVSPDLGLTQVDASLEPDGVTLPGGAHLSWPDVEEIAAHENACFALREDGLQRVQAFSAVTNRFCSLMPTALAPTLLVAGFPMHRIKGTDPHRDTLSKIRALGPISGHVLDTTTGLGYTAIEASLRAGHVTTIELDPAVLEVARLNPWSQRLFDNPKITQLVGDAAELIEDMADGTFSRIIHDPPTLSLAGDLYSGAFYRQLFRVLARGGLLFHYMGDPNSTSGRRVAKGAVRRLREAGFERVLPYPEAFGVVAHKS